MHRWEYSRGSNNQDAAGLGPRTCLSGRPKNGSLTASPGQARSFRKFRRDRMGQSLTTVLFPPRTALTEKVLQIRVLSLWK
jgi:hypothetical protein